MSYEDVLGCDDEVGLVVCICIAMAIPSSVLAKGVLCSVWCVCGTSPSMNGCGIWCVSCFYGVRSVSGVCFIRRIITLQWFVISAFSIRVKDVASRG